MVELVIADQAAVRLAAGRAEFLLVDLLEQRALIPRRPLEFLQRAAHLLLGDVHHPDLQLFIRLGIGDQMMQAAPGAFERFEVFVVNDQIHLLGELLVDLRNDRLDRRDRVLIDQGGAGQRLLRQGLDGVLHRGADLLRLRLELLVQETVKLRAFRGHRFRRGGGGATSCRRLSRSSDME